MQQNKLKAFIVCLKYSEIYTRSRDQDENWNDGRGLQTPRRNRDLITRK